MTTSVSWTSNGGAESAAGEALQMFPVIVPLFLICGLPILLVASTSAGNLAKYMAGISYLKMNDYENAITQLSNFSSDDEIIGGLALGNIGDAFADINSKGKRPYVISVSYGFVEINGKNRKSVDELIKEADLKMYEHKEKNRGKIDIIKNKED